MKGPTKSIKGHLILTVVLSQLVLAAGLVFGLVYEFGGTYVLSQRDVVIVAILIVVLVLRPSGLLGREGYR